MSYKTSKDHRAAANLREMAKQADLHDALKAPGPGTWSARMPAYAGTALAAEKK